MGGVLKKLVEEHNVWGITNERISDTKELSGLEDLKGNTTQSSASTQGRALEY